MKDVTARLNQTAFDGYFISIFNPCDVVVNYAREHMKLPKNRIFGTGTLLDTARLRLTLHQLTGVSANSIECFAMGEQVDSSMVAMSQISFMGKPLAQLQQEKPQIFGKVTYDILLERTHQLGMEIVIGKGSTEFGIGAALAMVCKAVLHDEKRILYQNREIQQNPTETRTRIRRGFLQAPLQMSKAPLAVGKRSFSCLQVLINRSGAADVFRARAGAEDVGLADLFD